MRVVTFKVDEDFFWEIENAARLMGITRSELIRRALELYLKLETPKRLASEPKRVVLYS